MNNDVSLSQVTRDLAKYLLDTNYPVDTFCQLLSKEYEQEKLDRLIESQAPKVLTVDFRSHRSH